MRFRRDGIFEPLDRKEMIALCRGQDAEIMQNRGMSWKDLQRGEIARLGLPQTTGGVMCDCIRNQFAKLRVHLLCPVRPMSFEVDEPGQVYSR